MCNQLIQCLVILAVLHTSMADPSNQIADLKNKLDEQLLKPIAAQLLDITNVVKSPKAIGQNYLTEFRGSIMEKLNEVKQIINNVKEDYSRSGKDISQCVQSHSEGFKPLPEKFMETATKCVDERVVEGEEDISTVVTDVTETQTAANKYLTKINECQSSSEADQVACREALAEELEMDGAKFAGGVKAAGVTVKDYLSSFKSMLELCTIGEISHFFMEANNVAAEVANCSVTKYDTTSDIWERAYRQPENVKGSGTVLTGFIGKKNGVIEFIVVLCIFAFKCIM